LRGRNGRIRQDSRRRCDRADIALGKDFALSGAMRTAVLSVALAGCAYRPGTFSTPLGATTFPGQRATVGCLDIAVERRTDLTWGAVVGYQFANRCDRPAPVDLAHAVVVGRTVDGVEVDLAPYDPDHELAALDLDGRTIGREAIAYASEVALAEVCVDAASVARGEQAQWLCFGSRP
jgi:hypothetical protein